MNRVFVSWSGGKDCSLAAYRAITAGMKVSYLANTVSADGQRSCSHGIAARLIRLQSQAMDIPLFQQPTEPNDYEAKFKEMVRSMKKEGITGGVFGDIDFSPHREWIERVCAEAGVTPHLPLWEESQEKLLKEFIRLGFQAVVVATRADILGEEWLGRRVDADFVRDLKAKGVTPCGEAGEYHTLVVDGPLFRQRLEIGQTSKVRRDNHCFLEISDISLRTK